MTRAPAMGRVRRSIKGWHRGPDKLFVGILVATLLVSGLVAEELLNEGLPGAMALHAGLMLLAWGMLLPFGAVAARYYKVVPGQTYPREVDNRFWWTWHRVLQYAGVAAATAGVLVMLSVTRDGFATLHGRLGVAVMAVAWAQVVSGLVRGSRGGPDAGETPRGQADWRGDHYDMTPRRRLFEAWHKRAGWAVLAAGAVVVLLGADLVGSPPWLLATVGALQAAALLGVADGVLRGRWVDTYKALWGPDPAHPGNRRPPTCPR